MKNKIRIQNPNTRATIRHLALVLSLILSAPSLADPIVTVLPNFDSTFGPACTAGTVYPGTGGVSCEYSVAEARRGNNSGNGDQELLIRTGGTFSTIKQEQLTWNPNAAFQWKLEGTAGGDVVFTITQGSQFVLQTTSSDYTVGGTDESLNPNNTQEVYIRLAGANTGQINALFDLLRINGDDFPGRIESDGAANYLLIQCVDFTADWTLEGTAEFQLVEGTGTAGSRPSFQIKLTETLDSDPPECEGDPGPAPAPVPSASAWSIVMLAFLLAILAATGIRRHV